MSHALLYSSCVGSSLILCYVLSSFSPNWFYAEGYTLNETMVVLNETVNLTDAEWSFQVTNSVLSEIEQNLGFYEKNKWQLDIRAAFQIFLTKLNLKTALDSPRMELYDNSENNPINSKRLLAITTRADNLGYIFRYRLRGRVPRKNLTRMVAAIFAFTELTWFKFLPPMHDDAVTTAVNEELAEIVHKKFNRTVHNETFFPKTPDAETYGSDDAVMNKHSKKALDITQMCIRELTQYLEDPAQLNKTLINETTFETTKCIFSSVKVKGQCRDFVERGVMNTTSGYELLFRIAVLTAARIARNCYVVDEYRDRVLRNYLCLIARLETDQFSPDTYKGFPKDFCQKDCLTRHDFATLCLLNGDTKFMHKRLMSCAYCDAAWNNVGCFGHNDLRIVGNFSVPPPYWIVVRQPASDNGFCFRRLTVSCLAHRAAVIRGLVEVGQVNSTEGDSGRRVAGDEEADTEEPDYGYDN